MDEIQRGGDSVFETLWLPFSVGVYSTASVSPLTLGQGIEATVPLLLVGSLVARGEALWNTRVRNFEYAGEIGLRFSLPAPWLERNPPHDSLRARHADLWFHFDASARLAPVTYDPARSDKSGKNANAIAVGPAMRAGVEYGGQVCVFLDATGSLLMFRTSDGRHVNRFGGGLTVGIRFYLF